jgi:hypothetical protein
VGRPLTGLLADRWQQGNAGDQRMVPIGEGHLGEQVSSQGN